MTFPSPSSAEAVIALTALSRRFGSKTVLNDVSLNVPRGSVFGLVGENGAGKTTLIKHILGLLRAEAGAERVFGTDPVGVPGTVLGSFGYLSELPDFPAGMLHQGKLVLCGPLDEIKAQHRRITLHFDTPQSKPSHIPGALSVTGAGREWTIICNASHIDPSAIAAALGASVVEQEAASLNEIF